MKHAVLLVVLAAAAAVVSGCYTAHDPDGTSRTDAGPITLSDGAIGRDARPPGRDSGPPVDCRSEVIDIYMGSFPACSEAVNECIRSCAGAEGCPEMCIASEPSCQTCFYQTVIWCANLEGCQDAWGDFACCTESVPLCSDVRGADRLQCAGSCGTEIEAWSGCFETTGAAMDCIARAFGTCGLAFP